VVLRPPALLGSVSTTTVESIGFKEVERRGKEEGRLTTINLRSLRFALSLTKLLLFDPSGRNEDGSVACIALEGLGHSFETGRVDVVKLAHGAVVGFDATSFSAFHVWSGGRFVHDELAMAFDLHGSGFMEEVDMKTAGDLREEAIDVLELLVIGFQGLNEVGRGVEELFGQNDATNFLQ
jgi:hypothetical protein